MPGAPLEDLIPDVSSLSTVSSVEEALKQSTTHALSIEERLEAQLTSSSSLCAKRALSLASAAQLSAAISDDAEELVSLLASAARTSTTACARIRLLHTQLDRGSAALAWAEDILALRVCAEGAKTSLSADDLPAAAAHVQKYLTLSDAVRADSASAAAISQIEQSRAELTRKVAERADAALSDPSSPLSTEKAVDVVRLFVPIACPRDGLRRLAAFLAARVKLESDADVRELLLDGKDETQSGLDEPHIVALARLFEGVAAAVHDCAPHLPELFGREGMPFLIAELQRECDVCGERILTRYKEARRVDEVLRALRSETANARDLDAFLNELTLLSQRMAAYFDFLEQQGSVEGDKEMGTDEEGRGADREIVKQSLEKCGLAQQRKELLGYYNAIEAYFMRENARLAIQIDESNGEGADTSTAVDDFFFVMQKCFQRAFAFGDTDVDVLRAILQQVSLCLMNDLLAYMRRRLRETETALEKILGGASATSALPTASLTVSYLTELAKANITIPGGIEDEKPAADVAKYDFFVALNNAAVSADYATRLRNNVEKSIQNSAKLSADEKSLLAAPVAQITDASRALVLAAEHGVSRLASVLLGRTTSVVEASLREASYVVTEGEYSLNSDATPSFSREVADELESKVLSSSLEKRLTEKNWDALVRQVAEWYASKVESLVFLPPISGVQSAKPFNAFGGLRADRDVRAISAYFSGKSRGSTVRDVFGRLSQLAMVVNLERPAEIYDIWGPNAGGMTWRLAPAEVRRALALRMDFNKDVVRGLKL